MNAVLLIRNSISAQKNINLIQDSPFFSPLNQGTTFLINENNIKAKIEEIAQLMEQNEDSEKKIQEWIWKLAASTKQGGKKEPKESASLILKKLNEKGCFQ